MNIGNNIRNIRKKKEMTLQQVADIMGCSPQLISQYETGKRIPKIEQIQKIASAFQCTVSDIMDNSSIDITKKEKSNFRQLPGNLDIDITKENYEKYKKYFNAAFSLIKEIMCNETNTKLFSVETGKELKRKDIEEIFDSLSTDEKLEIFQKFVENFTINPIFDAINIDLRKDEP